MKNNNTSVTVIVPVYNVAPYIEKCARSLFEQTLEDLEILFIDDLTQDLSIEIIQNVLKDYPNRESQTRIIKMSSNTGQAGVRRRGMIEATGQYVIHCDGDDWVDADLYKIMYDEAVRQDADIVVCDEVMEYQGYQVPKPSGKFHPNGKDVMRDWYKNTVGMFCHNKLVRRSIIIENDILPWIGLNMWEDNGLFSRLFYYAEKVVQISGGPLYHYNRANVNAMTAGYGIKQVNQMIDIAKNISDFYNSLPDGSEFRRTVDAFKYLARINLITDSFSQYSKFKHTYPESKYIASELDKGAFSAKGRARFYMVRFGLAPLFILLFKVRKFISK